MGRRSTTGTTTGDGPGVDSGGDVVRRSMVCCWSSTDLPRPNTNPGNAAAVAAAMVIGTTVGVRTYMSQRVMATLFGMVRIAELETNYRGLMRAYLGKTQFLDRPLHRYIDLIHPTVVVGSPAMPERGSR